MPTAIISFCFSTSISTFVPVLPLLVDTYQITRAAGGFLLSSFSLGRLLLEIPGGMLSDRFGIRRIALVGCLLSVLASLLAASMPSYPVLVIARIVQGTGSALYMTAAMTSVLSLAPEGRVGQILATYQGILLVGVSFGPTIGGLLAETWGVQGIFLAHSALAVLGVLVTLIWMPSQDRHVLAHPMAKVPRMRALLKDPVFLFTLLILFTVFTARSGVIDTLVPLLAVERFEFSGTEVGLLLTAAGVGTLLVLSSAGRSVDRSGKRRTLRLGLWGMVTFVVCIGFTSSPTTLFLLVGGAGAAKAYCAVVPAATLADVVSATSRGTAVGLQRMVTDLGLLVGPVVAGVAADMVGFSTACLLAAGAVTLVALSTSAFMREPSADLREPEAT